jgi:hypothetical protein
VKEKETVKILAPASRRTAVPKTSKVRVVLLPVRTGSNGWKARRMTMDGTKIDELERLAKAATPGPWKDKSFKRNYDWGVICSGGKRIAQCTSADVTDERKRVTFEEKLANAAYIAAACNAVPELIAKNRALQERVRELERELEVYREEKQLEWERSRDE